MLKAIWGYFSDKLSMPVSSLSRANIAEQLAARGVDSSTIDEVVALIDECEMAKYAPAASGEKLETVFNQGSEIIDKIERTKLNKSK